MATPTTYRLNYSDDYCKDEGPNCGGPCRNKIQFTSRETVFCRDVTFQSNVLVQGDFEVLLPEITVGGLKFRPRPIFTLSGVITVLAAN